MPRCRVGFFILILSLLLSPSIFAKELAAPSLTARSAVIVRNDDGALLYGKSPLSKLPPASTAKVMTVLIALEALDLNKQVLISPKAVAIEPTKAGLAQGATYAMRDLIKAALINSANDAAAAIAEGIAGSEERFVCLMNKKAAELGMKDTVFVNATGLPDKKKCTTTTYDLTILMREAAKNSLFLKIANLKDATIIGSDSKKIYLRNHNKMLWRRPGIIGKTGYTLRARHCFVGMDTSVDNPVAFAILSSRSLWGDVEKIVEFSRYLEK